MNAVDPNNPVIIMEPQILGLLNFTDSFHGNDSVTTIGPHTEDNTTPDVFANLLPALVEVFGIILVGYFAGRMNWITQTQGNGLGIYASKFAMPALLFQNMVQLSFSNVNWLFLASVFAAKSTVFAVVVLFTLLLVRPTNLGKMGIYGIFVTQSHDLALGIPIVQSLYAGTHDDFLQYLYLIAPISVAILNPLGFLLMEFHKAHQVSAENRKSKWRTLGTVVYGVVSNPIVFMTILGIAANFTFDQKVPSVVAAILKVVGDSFSSTALFCLGLSMVGQFKGQASTGFITPTLLIAAKMLLSPFLIREFVTVLDHGNTSVDYATYGFVYGMFPTAPTVFIYASLYDMEAQMVASAMVVSTFLAAPLMFISGKMLSISSFNSHSYEELINKTSVDSSILTFVCAVWVWIVFLINKRWRHIPQQFTSCLMLSQVLISVGVILYQYLDLSSSWQHVLQFTLFFTGVMGSRCWMSVLACALCLLRCRSLCFVQRQKGFFFLFGFGVPLVITGILLMVGELMQMDLNNDISFIYGGVQSIAVIVILVVNITITVTALVITHRHDLHLRAALREPQLPSDTPNGGTSDGAPPTPSRPILPPCERARLGGQVECSSSAPARAAFSTIIPERAADAPPCSPDGTADALLEKRKRKRRTKPKVPGIKRTCDDCTSGCGGEPHVTNIEDLVPDVLIRRRHTDTVTSEDSALLTDGNDSEEEGNAFISEQFPSCPTVPCALGETEDCPGLQDACVIVTTVEDMENRLLMQDHDEFQYTRHLVLILMLLASSFVGLFLCIWKMMSEAKSGVYIEIEILDCVLTYGQGFLTFAMFGLDSELIIAPIVKRCRKWWYGEGKVHLRPWQELEFHTQLTCEQFVTYHRDVCAKAIVKNCCRRRLRTYRQVFLGADFVDWLLEVGLASDRSDAVTYGRRLVEGAVIEHVDQECHFYDLPYMYQFCRHASSVGNGSSTAPISSIQNSDSDDTSSEIV